LQVEKRTPVLLRERILSCGPLRSLRCKPDAIGNQGIRREQVLQMLAAESLNHKNTELPACRITENHHLGDNFSLPGRAIE
jgi:hypothetical protein